MDSSDATLLRADAPPGLFLDRAGRWFHDGQRVGHRRLEALLHRSISRASADDSLIVTTGRDRLPFIAEDAPLCVRAFDSAAQSASLALSDGTVEAVAPRRFVVDRLGVIRCPVHDGAFWAILSRSAAQILATYIEDDGTALRGPFTGCTIVEAPPDRTRWDGRATALGP